MYVCVCMFVYTCPYTYTSTLLCYMAGQTDRPDRQAQQREQKHACPTKTIEEKFNQTAKAHAMLDGWTNIHNRVCVHP